MTLPIGLAWCADCGSSQPLTVHGACSRCLSDAILPRRIVQPVEYVPDERSRCSLAVETTPDELVMP